MSILSKLSNFLRRERPSTLRNKPGGLAWISNRDSASLELRGRIVTTVRCDERAFWMVDPPQSFVLSDYAVNIYGQIVAPGTLVNLVTISDECLIPIPDAGISDEEVRELYAPKQTEVA